MKIKDKILLSTVSGFTAVIPLTIIDYILYLFEVNEYTIWQIAGSPYFKTKDIDTIPAVITGLISHFTVVGIGSVFLCYLLYYTGREYYWLKGIGGALTLWLFSYGVTLRGHIARIDPVDGGTNLVHLAAHILGGLATSWLIIKLAEEEVWDY